MRGEDDAVVARPVGDERCGLEVFFLDELEEPGESHPGVTFGLTPQHLSERGPCASPLDPTRIADYVADAIEPCPDLPVSVGGTHLQRPLRVGEQSDET